MEIRSWRLEPKNIFALQRCFFNPPSLFLWYNYQVEDDRLKEQKELALRCVETLVEVSRESFLILDADLRVISANATFYQNFKLSPAQTKDKFFDALGDGQWRIAGLKNLLEKILPERKIISDYEITYFFPTLGQKILLINARQIDEAPLIILTIDDITAKRNFEQATANYAQALEIKVAERTEELTKQIKELETLNRIMIDRELKMMELKKQIEDLKKKISTGLVGKYSNGMSEGGNGNHR